jgi:hypothetical protein
MWHFEFRFLDKLNHPFLTRDYSGQDDFAALAEAERLSDDDSVIEVWRAERKIAFIKNRKLKLAKVPFLGGLT